jgi:hypothetical protein
MINKSLKVIITEIWLVAILAIIPLTGCAAKTATTTGVSESNEPPDSTAAILWQQAPCFKGTDVVVTVSGPIVGAKSIISPGITAFMGADNGTGLDLYFVNRALFDQSWVGKTLTVTGEIINSDYESAQLNITDSSQILLVR